MTLRIAIHGVVLVLAGAAGALRAAGPASRPAVTTEIRQQFHQVLHGIRDVVIDSQGRPWLWTPYERGVEDSYHSEVKLLPPYYRLLLADSKARVWLNHRYQGRKPTRMYDGKGWQTMPFRGLEALEDSAGRVFIAGTSHLHVLEGKTWRGERHSDKDLWVDWRMRPDADGGLWAWAVYKPPGWRPQPPHPPGAWCWRKGRWAHHTAAGGFATDKVAMVVALGGGRYLVTTREKDVKPNYWVWSWRAAGGKPVAEAERHHLMPGVSAKHLQFIGTDLDGSAYFSAMDLWREGRKFRPGKTTVVSFSPDGKGRILDMEGYAFRMAAMQTGERLWLSRRDLRRWQDGQARAPLVGGLSLYVYGVDKRGRIFYRTEPSREIAVLWPAYEKPGDVLRASRPGDAPKGRAFQDPAGGIWLLAQPPKPLYRWRGGRWQATPVEIKPHPQWRAEMGPPWTAWRRGVRVVCGRDGSLLAATVRDIFQEIAPGPDGQAPSWREISRAGREAQQAGKGLYWVEAWLYRGGEWTGPLKVRELLRRHAADMIKAFTAQTTDFSWFDVQSDGARLWWACDGEVHAVTAEGKVASWAMPLPPGRAGRLGAANLVCMKGGKTWCVHTDGRKLAVSALSTQGGQIWSTPLAGAGWSVRSARHVDGLYVSADGTLWRSKPRSAGGPQSLQGECSQWKNGRWRQRSDLGPLLLEDDAGGLWFARPWRKIEERGFLIVHKDRTQRLDWPMYVHIGPLTQAGPGTLFAACGRHLVRLARPGKGGRWRIERIQLLQGASEGGGAFLDGKGRIVGASGWSAKLPSASATP